MAVSMTLLGPGEFPYNDELRGTAGTRWPVWVRDFELYLEGSGVKDAGQKKSLLLYTMGTAAREIYFTIKGGSDDYAAVKKAMSTYFAPLKNLDYEIFVFSQMRQRESESLDDFVIRLRVAAARCEFATGAVDGEIKRQVICGCQSARLKEKILSKPGAALDDILTLARLGECATMQANEMGRSSGFIKTESINAVRTGAKCFACGRDFPHTGDCPAKDKKCLSCGELGHFAASKYCKQPKDKRDKRVNAVTDEKFNGEERFYVF